MVFFLKNLEQQLNSSLNGPGKKLILINKAQVQSQPVQKALLGSVNRSFLRAGQQAWQPEPQPGCQPVSHHPLASLREAAFQVKPGFCAARL